MTLYLYETRFGNTKKLAEMTRSYDLDPNAVLAEMDGWVHSDYKWSPAYRVNSLDLVSDSYESTEPVVLFVPTYENIQEQRKTGEALRYASKDSLIYAQELAVRGRLVGVVVAGNRTFGSKFCAATQDFLNLPLTPAVPILAEVELFGDPSDWKAVARAVEAFNEQR